MTRKSCEQIWSARNSKPPKKNKTCKTGSVRHFIGAGLQECTSINTEPVSRKNVHHGTQILPRSKCGPQIVDRQNEGISDTAGADDPVRHGRFAAAGERE